jgi:hypothetical protein
VDGGSRTAMVLLVGSTLGGMASRVGFGWAGGGCGSSSWLICFGATLLGIVVGFAFGSHDDDDKDDRGW